jgi:hypothetical protein
MDDVHAVLLAELAPKILSVLSWQADNPLGMAVQLSKLLKAEGLVLVDVTSSYPDRTFEYLAGEVINIHDAASAIHQASVNAGGSDRLFGAPW